MKPLPPNDLDHILTVAHTPFQSLCDARIFITGGTGFFGHWLLESLLHANRALSLDARATVLTRNAAAFRTRSPHITADPAITLLEGDITTFAFPPEPHTHILHAATDTTTANGPALAASILAGTRRVLDFAHHTGARRFLFTSTGAVYGRSTTLPHTPESYLETNSPHLTPDSYESAKRDAEILCLDRTSVAPLEPQLSFPVEVVIARCFAFVGPHLPLDAHFAIGNFIRDALAGAPIHIRGDGSPRRSYLYVSDLAIWLWTLLTLAPASSVYNVGSDQSVSIAQLAHTVAEVLAAPDETHTRPVTTLQSVISTEAQRSGKTPVFLGGMSGPAAIPTMPVPIQIDGTPDPAAPLNSYVPDITLARTTLGLNVTIPLADAIRRTAAWHMQTVDSRQ